MNARLFCKTGQLAGVVREFRDEATIGKESGNSLSLDAAPISGRHARIFFDPKAGAYIIEDLGSRNGTRVDGVPVREKEKLGNLHVITFAEKFDFIFQVITETPAGTPPRPETAVNMPQTPRQPEGQKTVVDDVPIIAPPRPKPQGPATILDDTPVAAPNFDKKPAPPKTGIGNKTLVDDEFIAAPALPSIDKKPPGAKQPDQTGTRPDSSASPVLFELEVSVGPTAAFTLREGENDVGRSETCVVHIEDNSLSRRHALITVTAGRVTLKDLGSKNSTFIGNNRIKDEVEIVPGAELRFGLVQARLRQKR